MGTSKQLITAIEKSDWLDRLLIITSVAFFFLVVLFILKQRILDRGLRIALWWTRFLPSGDIDFDKLEKGVLGTATAIASTVAASASSSLASLSPTMPSGSAVWADIASTSVTTSLSSTLESVVSSAADTTWTTSTVPIESVSSGVRDEL